MNLFPTCIQTYSCSTSPLLASLSLLAFALSVLCHQSPDCLCATPLVQSPFVALASLSPPYGDLFACRHTATTLLICAHSPRPLVSIFLMIADLSGQSILFPLCPHNSKLEAAPLANPSPCLDSPFHILLHFLFRVLFTATPSANPILSLDSPFHSLLPCSAVLQPCQRLHSNQKQLLQQTQFSAWILLSTVLSPCLEFCSQLLLW